MEGYLKGTIIPALEIESRNTAQFCETCQNKYGSQPGEGVLESDAIACRFHFLSGRGTRRHYNPE
jgi:hypothetical protein